MRPPFEWASLGIAPTAFACYARRVVEALGVTATFYITVVEPKVFAGRAHLLGQWPP